MIWIVPVFIWHNEMVQYIKVYVDQYLLKKEDGGKQENDTQHLVSLGLIQRQEDIFSVELEN